MTMTMNEALTQMFLDVSRRTLVDEYWPRLRGCVESLTDDQIWWRPNEASNSIGNILLHLNGNVRQWLVVPFLGGADERDRPAEFAQRDRIPGIDLLRALGATIEQADMSLTRLTAADLLAVRDIQGYTATGLDAVYHVVEHFGMHYGQIVYVTKQLRGVDLRFYKALDATGRLE